MTGAVVEAVAVEAVAAVGTGPVGFEPVGSQQGVARLEFRRVAACLEFRRVAACLAYLSGCFHRHPLRRHRLKGP